MSASWPEGRLLELWDKRTLLPVMLLSHGDEGVRIRYMSPKGRPSKCAISRVAHDTGIDLDPGASREEIMQRLAGWEASARERTEDLSLETLWEVVHEEPSTERSLEELAVLALDTEEPLERSALLRALLEDPLYFDKKGDAWLPRDEDKVEEARKRIAAEESRKRRKEELELAVRNAMDGSSPSPGFLETHAEVVEALESIVLGGPPHPEAGLAQEILPRGPGASASELRRTAFEVLVAFGLYDEKEDLGRRRLGLDETFPAAVERAAEEANRRLPDALDDPGRLDLSGLPLWAIDQEDTREVDDAVGILEPAGEDGVWTLVVAVADAAAFIEPDDPVDQEALRRATAHYLPSGAIPMIPAALGEQAASLVAGERRPALAFLCRVDEEGLLQGFEARPAVVEDVRRATYTEATELLEEGEETLQALHRLARARLRKRHADGAVILRQPDVELDVHDGEVDLTIVDPGAPSRILVSELMVLAGAGAAAWLCERQVPAIYRRQPPPDNLPSAVGDPSILDSPYDPVLIRSILKRMRPSTVGVEPGRHAALGLDAYCQVTSPLRRYQDLAVHRQILAVLREEPPPYDEDAIMRVAATTEEAERESRRAERESREFWLLEHLAAHEGATTTAVVLETGRNRTLVELEPYLWNARVAPRESHEPGARLEVRIEQVDPRAGKVRLSEITPSPSSPPSDDPDAGNEAEEE